MFACLGFQVHSGGAFLYCTFPTSSSLFIMNVIVIARLFAVSFDESIIMTPARQTENMHLSNIIAHKLAAV